MLMKTSLLCYLVSPYLHAFKFCSSSHTHTRIVVVRDDVLSFKVCT